MTNFLIDNNNIFEHYFYRPYEGICRRIRTSGGFWQNHIVVCEKGRDGFGIYSDKNSCLHIICVNTDNQLIYSTFKNGIQKKYILSSLSPDITVSNMRLYSINGRMNLIYSAVYGGKNLLIHCILGNHAKPSTIAYPENSHFCISGTKVYYTSSDGILGYSVLSDEKPDTFHKLYDDAHFCNIFNENNNTHIVYTRSGKLFLDDSELVYDSRMEMPIMIKSSDLLYIMWKSGGFIRYITSKNGENWSEVMRFMATDTPASIYIVQQENHFNYFYGYSTENNLHLFGKPQIFKTTQAQNSTYRTELENLRKLLDCARHETNEAKKEISRLKNLLEDFPGLK